MLAIAPELAPVYTSERHDSSQVAYRFRSGADWFVASAHDSVQIMRIGANSERAVALFHGLLAALANSVDVAIESLRDGRAWRGEDCSRNEVRDTVARLKLLLSSYGGVEIAAYTGEHQITLTPELEVFVYSRTQRWRAHLVSMGLEEQADTPTAVWRPPRRHLNPAPELSDALASAARRLRLLSVAPELSDT